MTRNILLATLFTVLAGCAATGPTISSNADPTTDFASIRTFSFMTPLGTDRPGGVRTPLSQMLANAVIKELESRGWQQSDNPDVAINFFVNTEQRLDVRQVPTRSSFHHYRGGRYRTWGGYETRVREFTQGTLSIDMVDISRNMLVWEGVAVGRLGREVEIDQARVDEVVAAVFTELPQ